MTADPAPARHPHKDPYRWTILGVAVLAQATGSIVAQGVYSLVPFLQQAFALTQAQAAYAVSAVNAGQVASMLLVGWAIDRFGERRVVALTMVAMGLAAFAASTVTRHPVLLAWLVLLGACYASVQPGGTAAMVRWFAPAQRGLATGIRQAALPLGTALAAMALPVLASERGWPAAMLVQGVFGILGGLAFGAFYRKAGDDAGAGSGKAGTAPGGALRKEAASGRVAAPAPRPPNPLQLIREVWAYDALWPVMLAGAAMVTFQFTFMTHALTFVSHRFGVSTVIAGLLFSVTQWVGIVGRIALAWLSDRWWPGRRMRTLAATMVACAAATVVLAFVPAETPRWLLVALFVVVGLFGIGWFPLYLLQVAEMAPPTAVASTIAFSLMMNMAAITVVPPLFGLIVDLAGYAPAWLALAAVVVVALVNLRRGTAA